MYKRHGNKGMDGDGNVRDRSYRETAPDPMEEVVVRRRSNLDVYRDKVKAGVIKPTPKARTPKSRTKLYRDTYFLFVPVGDMVRVYTLDAQGIPEYQLTVKSEDADKTLNPLWRMAQAEAALNEIAQQDAAKK